MGDDVLHLGRGQFAFCKDEAGITPAASLKMGVVGVGVFLDVAADALACHGVLAHDDRDSAVGGHAGLLERQVFWHCGRYWAA